MITLKYPHGAGQFKDRLWCAVDDETNEALDYGKLPYLVRRLQEECLNYRIERYHLDGTISYERPKGTIRYGDTTNMKLKTRIRASEDAIVKAIKAAQTCGRNVESLLISGGKVELKLGAIENTQHPKNADGLKEWD